MKLKTEQPGGVKTGRLLVLVSAFQLLLMLLAALGDFAILGLKKFFSFKRKIA